MLLVSRDLPGPANSPISVGDGGIFLGAGDGEKIDGALLIDGSTNEGGKGFELGIIMVGLGGAGSTFLKISSGSPESGWGEIVGDGAVLGKLPPKGAKPLVGWTGAVGTGVGG